MEVFNACRSKLENKMADIYADNYGLIKFAGSDNHAGSALKKLSGIETDMPITDENDFIERIRKGNFKIFILE